MTLASTALKVGARIAGGAVSGPVGWAITAASMLPLLVDLASNGSDPEKIAAVKKQRDDAVERMVVEKGISREKALAVVNENMKPLMEQAQSEGGGGVGLGAVAGLAAGGAALNMRGAGLKKAALAARRSKMPQRPLVKGGGEGDASAMGGEARALEPEGDLSAMGGTSTPPPMPRRGMTEIDIAEGKNAALQGGRPSRPVTPVAEPPVIRGLTPDDIAEGKNAALQGGRRRPQAPPPEPMQPRGELTQTDIDEGIRAAMQGPDLKRMEELKAAMIQANLGRRTAGDSALMGHGYEMDPRLEEKAKQMAAMRRLAELEQSAGRF